MIALDEGAYLFILVNKEVVEELLNDGDEGKLGVLVWDLDHDYIR